MSAFGRTYIVAGGAVEVVSSRRRKSSLASALDERARGRGARTVAVVVVGEGGGCSISSLTDNSP